MTKGLIIHTGNILQLPDLKRKPGHTPADELYDALKIQLGKTFSNGDAEILAPLELSSLLVPEERNSQKITVKLFLSSPQPEFIKLALTAALNDLGSTCADLFLISWPAGISQEDGITLWNAMETVVDQELAYSLGISDVDTQAFVELHNFSRIKPEAIQINLESCCVVPPELVTFTRENNIQLLTHNDPQNILPAETLKTVVPSLQEVIWTVRYQTLLRCRGIIKNKGYVVSTYTA